MREVELQRWVCHGLVSQEQVQRDVAEDWVAAYRHYVLGAPFSGSQAGRPGDARAAQGPPKS